MFNKNISCIIVLLIANRDTLTLLTPCFFWCDDFSCLPCGHIYGLSCIKKWLLQRRSSGKVCPLCYNFYQKKMMLASVISSYESLNCYQCPQCNQFCTSKDVRVLYASRLCVADEELHKVITLKLIVRKNNENLAFRFPDLEPIFCLQRVRSLEAKCAYLEQKV